MTTDKHPCRWSRSLYIVGPLLLGSLIWLASEAYGSAIERATMRTKLEIMGDDLGRIRQLLEEFAKKN